MNTTSHNLVDFFNNLFDDRMYTLLAEDNYARLQIMKAMEKRDPFQHMDHYSYKQHTCLSTWKDLNSTDIKIFIAHILCENLLSTTTCPQVLSPKHHFLDNTWVKISFKISYKIFML